MNRSCVDFASWTKGRVVDSLGTNAGAQELPFQGWRRFKEAFAPELVARAVTSSRTRVESCLDPFGGSGTTALACQFLGVRPVAVEVNPFLADLIAAKLETYDPDLLVKSLGEVIRTTNSSRDEPSLLVPSGAPRTFVEPGKDERWIFNLEVAGRIVALRQAIEALEDPNHRRLFRVLLGGILIDISNVTISGKGRRYRSGWQQSECRPEEVLSAFTESTRRAISDIGRFGKRSQLEYELYRGDSRNLLRNPDFCKVDLAVFSPPYPNSFDYTDVYNVELWVLGYLTSSESNLALRNSTLSSHVQILRQYEVPPEGSSLLDTLLDGLSHANDRLWNRWIPSMVGAYFSEMTQVLSHMSRLLNAGGRVWIVVGDSRYAGIKVRSAEIIEELASTTGYRTVFREPFRSMRVSPQQGGSHELSETLLVLETP